MKIKRPFFFILTIIFGLATLYIIKDFATLIISSFFLAYMVMPIYRIVRKVIKNKGTSSFIAELIFIVIVSTVFYLAVSRLLSQITNFSSPILIEAIEKIENRTTFNNTIELDNPLTRETINSIIKIGQNIVATTPIMLINSFLLVYTVYYIVKNEEEIYDFIISIAPKDSRAQIARFIGKIDILTREVIYGYFLSAIMISMLTFVLLTILNIRFSADYALFSGITSLIPIVGSWIVPIFLSLYYILRGNYIFALIFIVYGYIATSITTMIKPIVSRNRYNIHPLLFIIGIIVGIYSFGIFGFLIGPIVFGIAQIGFEEIVYKRKI